MLQLTVVCPGPSAVKRTSISLACAGSGSYCQVPSICQVTTSRCGGSQASTVPQSHSEPSVPRSYQRPPRSAPAPRRPCLPCRCGTRAATRNRRAGEDGERVFGRRGTVRSRGWPGPGRCAHRCSCSRSSGAASAAFWKDDERLVPDPVEVGPQGGHPVGVEPVDPAGALGLVTTRPPSLSTRRCWETAGRLTGSSLGQLAHRDGGRRPATRRSRAGWGHPAAPGRHLRKSPRTVSLGLPSIACKPCACSHLLARLRRAVP